MAIRHGSTRSIRQIACIGFVVLLLLSACSGGSKSGNSGGDAASDPASGTADPDTSDVKVDEPIQVSYQHVSDSSATSPYEGATTRLLFEPGGDVSIYVADDESGLGRHGTYSYDDGKLTLHIASDEVTVDSTFELDLNADKPTFPFQAFSTEEGTSTWQREVLGVMDGTDSVFQAARYDDAVPVPREEAVARAQAYAAARVELDGGVLGEQSFGGPLAPGGTDATKDQLGPVRLVSARQQSTEAPKIVSTEKFANGVTLIYDDGSRADVVLFSWKSDAAAANDTLALRPSPIASDPRVEVPTTKSPGDGSADPTNKTALLANPFATEFDETQIVADATKTLKDSGYTVTSVQDSKATFEGITDGLGAGTSGGTPGFITLSTHGGANGSMATSEYLGVPGSPADDAALIAKMRTVAERIDKAYPGSRTFEINGTKSQPFQLLEYSHGPNDRKVYVGLSPYYWNWIKSEGASFASSFVFLSACESDVNPDIRTTVAAKVFAGFSEQANITAAKTAFAYIVEQLARSTRSAEEAFYNLVRVVNTGQTIYKEDQVFDGTPSKALSKILKLYGGGTGAPVEYFGNGWLDGDALDQGQVWWMAFSGRWSGDAAEGASKLQNCWDLFWSQGNKGGLASPACNASNSGNLPTAAEVSYAIYLLTGKDAIASSAKVPRWTLADGRTS
jgi:hypothetical protein